MKLHHDKLRQRGWSDKEIADAHAILERAEAKKHPGYKFLEKAVFWGLLFFSFVGIILVALLVTPLLLLLPDLLTALVLLVLGLSLGALFALAVLDIEWLEQKHHVLTVVLLLLFAFAALWFTSLRVGSLTGEVHKPFLLGALFALAFVTPRLFFFIKEVTP